MYSVDGKHVGQTACKQTSVLCSCPQNAYGLYRVINSADCSHVVTASGKVLTAVVSGVTLRLTSITSPYTAFDPNYTPITLHLTPVTPRSHWI